jgi:hypothetical protein
VTVRGPKPKSLLSENENLKPKIKSPKLLKIKKDKVLQIKPAPSDLHIDAAGTGSTDAGVHLKKIISLSTKNKKSS